MSKKEIEMRIDNAQIELDLAKKELERFNFRNSKIRLLDLKSGDVFRTGSMGVKYKFIGYLTEFNCCDKEDYTTRDSIRNSDEIDSAIICRCLETGYGLSDSFSILDKYREVERTYK